MKILSYSFETELRFSSPVTRHSFVLRCMPKSTNTQKVMESHLLTEPRIPLNEQEDGFGNRIVSGYCAAAHDRFCFYSRGQAMVSTDLAGATPAHPMFLQQSPRCVPDDAMKAAALAVMQEVVGASGAAQGLCVAQLSGAMPGSVTGVGTEGERFAHVWEVAQALSHMVFEHFAYDTEATDTTTTAVLAFASGRGVCQDYAHVLIALCREVGIPARYVTGLMIGEGATHAWVEVHDGVRWRGLDPTNDKVVDNTYLLFCTGRDFEDCPIERGVFRGSALQEQTISATLADSAAERGPAVPQF